MSTMPERIVALKGPYTSVWVSEDMDDLEQIKEVFRDGSATYVRDDLARADLTKALTDRAELKRALKQLVRMVDGTPVDDNETYNLAQITIERCEA